MGQINEEVTHRIRTSWLKWKSEYGISCDGKIPLKLKRKFYKIAMRVALSYGT